jgi:hypothetical protein
MLADDHPLWRLAEQYPACFDLVGHERQPIKIGIGHELAVLDTGLTPLQLGRALATYVRHSGYQCNIREGAKRIGLDGMPVVSSPSRRRPTPRRRLPGWPLSGLAKMRPWLDPRPGYPAATRKAGLLTIDRIRDPSTARELASARFIAARPFFITGR